MTGSIIGGDGDLFQDGQLTAPVRYAFELIPGQAHTVGELTLQDANDFDPSNLQGIELRLADGRVIRITV
jgi:hypothetical protein